MMDIVRNFESMLPIKYLIKQVKLKKKIGMESEVIIVTKGKESEITWSTIKKIKLPGIKREDILEY